MSILLPITGLKETLRSILPQIAKATGSIEVALKCSDEPDFIFGYKTNEDHFYLFDRKGFKNFVMLNTVTSFLATGDVLVFREAKKNEAVLQSISEYCSKTISNTKKHGGIIRQTENDLLTGLPNKAYIEKIIKKEITISKDRGKTFCLLLINLDNFKTINESCGRIVGDEVLRRTTKTIKKLLHKTDSIGRYDGDEFIVVLGETSKEEGVKFRNNIMKEVSQGQKKEPPVSVSVGIALFPSDGETFQELLSCLKRRKN